MDGKISKNFTKLPFRVILSILREYHSIKLPDDIKEQAIKKYPKLKSSDFSDFDFECEWFLYECYGKFSKDKTKKLHQIFYNFFYDNCITGNFVNTPELEDFKEIFIHLTVNINELESLLKKEKIKSIYIIKGCNMCHYEVQYLIKNKYINEEDVKQYEDEDDSCFTHVIGGEEEEGECLMGYYFVKRVKIK